jgi:hypothetical protein
MKSIAGFPIRKTSLCENAQANLTYYERIIYVETRPYLQVTAGRESAYSGSGISVAQTPIGTT